MMLDWGWMLEFYILGYISVLYVSNRSCEEGCEKTQTANCKELVKNTFPLSTPSFSWQGKCRTILNLDSVHFTFNLSHLEAGQLQCFYTAVVSRSANSWLKQTGGKHYWQSTVLDISNVEEINEVNWRKSIFVYSSSCWWKGGWGLVVHKIFLEHRSKTVLQHSAKQLKQTGTCF